MGCGWPAYASSRNRHPLSPPAGHLQRPRAQGFEATFAMVMALVAVALLRGQQWEQVHHQLVALHCHQGEERWSIACSYRGKVPAALASAAPAPAPHLRQSNANYKEPVCRFRLAARVRARTGSLRRRGGDPKERPAETSPDGTWGPPRQAFGSTLKLGRRKQIVSQPTPSP